MSFKQFLREETTSADIAGVETKLSMSRRSNKQEKGKRCKKHKRTNCEDCSKYEDNKYN